MTFLGKLQSRCYFSGSLTHKHPEQRMLQKRNRHKAKTHCVIGGRLLITLRIEGNGGSHGKPLLE